jgi:uncharacterized protein YbaR (Trm112 family)
VVAFIIFGWGKGTTKDIGAALPYDCPNCKNGVMLHYITVTTWFSLFFIPLIPYQVRHLLICPVCTRMLKVDREHVPQAKQLVAARAALTAGSMSEEQYEREVQSFWAAVTGAGAALPTNSPQSLPPPVPSPPPIPPPPSTNGDPA